MGSGSAACAHSVHGATPCEHADTHTHKHTHTHTGAHTHRRTHTHTPCRSTGPVPRCVVTLSGTHPDWPCLTTRVLTHGDSWPWRWWASSVHTHTHTHTHRDTQTHTHIERHRDTSRFRPACTSHAGLAPAPLWHIKRVCVLLWFSYLCDFCHVCGECWLDL